MAKMSLEEKMAERMAARSEELEITTLRINKIFSSFRKITVMDDKKKERLDEILDELENLLKEEN